MRGSHKRRLADPCGKKQHKGTEQEEINWWHWSAISSWHLSLPWNSQLERRDEYKQEKSTLAPLCKSNLSAPARWGAFIYILAAWQREWIQTEPWEDERNPAHGCNFRTCYRHYNFNVAVERYTPQANELAEDLCMCQGIAPHENFIAPWQADSEILISDAVCTCVLLIKELSKFL